MKHTAEYSKLRWHCRRGVKELDIVFCEFLENHYPFADKEIQDGFKELLQIEDPTLLSLLMNYQTTDNELHNRIIIKLRDLF